MFNPKHYRDKAAEYSERGKTANGPDQAHEFRQLQKSFAALADNEQWLADNHQSTVSIPQQDRSNGATIAEEEEHILRCLGAALILQWNTVPTKLRRELFDNASSMGELLQTAELRARIARFLHRHEDDVG